jgi:hypothetical protein
MLTEESQHDNDSQILIQQAEIMIIKLKNISEFVQMSMIAAQ